MSSQLKLKEAYTAGYNSWSDDFAINPFELLSQKSLYDEWNRGYLDAQEDYEYLIMLEEHNVDNDQLEYN